MLRPTVEGIGPLEVDGFGVSGAGGFELRGYALAALWLPAGVGADVRPTL